jgi:hypothetical protein
MLVAVFGANTSNTPSDFESSDIILSDSWLYFAKLALDRQSAKNQDTTITAAIANIINITLKYAVLCFSGLIGLLFSVVFIFYGLRRLSAV